MISSSPPSQNLPPPIDGPEPTPAAPRTERSPRYGSIIVGLVVLGVGLWYFADRTLGLALPALNPGQLWPIVIIGVGAWLIVRPRR